MQDVREPMPRAPSENTAQIVLRVPESWLTRADAILPQIARHGVVATRTDAFRAAISRGLDAYESDKIAGLVRRVVGASPLDETEPQKHVLVHHLAYADLRDRDPGVQRATAMDEDRTNPWARRDAIMTADDELQSLIGRVAVDVHGAGTTWEIDDSDRSAAPAALGIAAEPPKPTKKTAKQK